MSKTDMPARIWVTDETAHGLPYRTFAAADVDNSDGHYPEYVRADLVREAMEALEEALEYFDNKSDADHDGTGFVPNTEMTMASIVDAALSKLKEAGL